ncbi:MAG: hypothetical protein AAF197_11970, partial [Pseudomonadota bacterium]
LREEGAVIDRSSLVVNLIETLVASLLEYEKYGFKPFIPAWQSISAHQHKKVLIKDSETKMIGVQTGVAHDGALLVTDSKHKVHRFSDVGISLRLAE